ncbi:MAG: copper resistance protein CopC [Thermomicrobiales bacterium]|nr:copper resistance protein CopC [Thermomicrobiales bacterium]MCO5221780.1 copper resistance protein CopC [Thermomicrobiales bacterium]
MSRLERTIVQWSVLTLIVALACMLTGQQSLAEAIPQRASPPMDQAVPVMPTTIEVWFSEAIDPDGTTLTVLKQDGTQVDLGDTTVDAQDATGTRVSISVHPGLDNGVYLVEWTARSAVDGSTASGQYQFTVDPTASPEPLPQIVAQDAPVGRPDAGESEDQDESGRSPVFYGVAATIAVLAFVTVLTLWYFRRAARGRRWSDRPVDRL